MFIAFMSEVCLIKANAPHMDVGRKTFKLQEPRERQHNCNDKIKTLIATRMSRFILGTVKVIPATTYTFATSCIFTHTATKGSYFLRKRIYNIVTDFLSFGHSDPTTNRAVPDRKLIRMKVITGLNQTCCWY